MRTSRPTPSTRSAHEEPLLDPCRLEKADIEFIVLGESRVGKSTTVAALNDRHYRNIDSTIGVEFSSRTFDVPEGLGGVGSNGLGTTASTPMPKRIHIKVWDTAGQERYRALIQGYFVNKAAAILMFDVTDRRSFSECREWLRQLRAKTNNPHVVVSLVGNKTEDKMAPFRVVPAEEARAWAESEGMRYYEVSAVRNEGVADMFQETVVRVLKVLNLHPTDWAPPPERHRGIQLHAAEPKRSVSWCCVTM